jgi:hypothetical protein
MNPVGRVRCNIPARTGFRRGGPGAVIVLKRHTYTCVMKAPWTDPGLRELVALAALSAFGCGLALAQGDFLLATIFAAAIGMIIIEALRPLG